MNPTSIKVKCKTCKTVLTESPSLPVASRKPCPSCGSLDREVEAVFSFSVGMGITLNAKKLSKGKKRPLEEILTGEDLHKKTGKWMNKLRIIDRDNDLYHEIITDPVTGKVIHECKESLSKHTGHGSAKNGNKKGEV